MEKSFKNVFVLFVFLNSYVLFLSDYSCIHMFGPNHMLFEHGFCLKKPQNRPYLVCVDILVVLVFAE